MVDGERVQAEAQETLQSIEKRPSGGYSALGDVKSWDSDTRFTWHREGHYFNKYR